MNGVNEKVLFTFPVVVATHCQSIWQVIEPFVDHLDIPCERFIISLKSRDPGIATYNVGCVMKSFDLEKMLKTNEFQDVVFSNYRSLGGGWFPEKSKDFNKEINSQYAIGTYDRLLVKDELYASQYKQYVQKQTKEYAESINTKSTFPVSNRYNHWLLRKLKKGGELKFFDDDREVDIPYIESKNNSFVRSQEEKDYVKQLEGK